jgi:hypothetical protein
MECFVDSKRFHILVHEKLLLYACETDSYTYCNIYPVLELLFSDTTYVFFFQLFLFTTMSYMPLHYSLLTHTSLHLVSLFHYTHSIETQLNCSVIQTGPSLPCDHGLYKLYSRKV